MIYTMIIKWVVKIMLMMSGFIGFGQFHCEFQPAAAGAIGRSAEGAQNTASGSSYSEDDYIDSVFEGWGSQVMPSVGEVRFPVFVVEFQDVRFGRNMVELDEIEDWVFGERDSVAEYYDISSYGRLHVDGDVYYYEAKGNISEYEEDRELENLIMEILRYYEDEVDFSQYDKNGDSVMDSLVISVPTGGDTDFWWGAQHTWYWNRRFRVDGLMIVGYIVNDEQPYKKEKEYYLGTLEHELGHCMGLPDYYKYEYTGSDWEGFRGIAGMERMDDSKGDFCQFSKLQLGWLREDQVQIMPSDVDRASFFLPPVKDGGCVVIFPRGKYSFGRRPDFQGEYFVVEYNTPEELQKGLFGRGGVRMFHVQAQVTRQSGYYDYRYSNFSEEYDTSNEGIRVLKLVNDGRGFYHEGDKITFEGAGGEEGNFGWYTEDGRITPPGFHIEIVGLDKESGCMEIEVVWEDDV